MTSAEFIAWAESMDADGVKDTFGYSYTTYQIAVMNLDGTCKRGPDGYQIYETQADYKARIRAIPVGQTLELFA
jgi:hypothetical protein